VRVEPYWQSSDGRLVIYHGDCRDVLPQIEADVLVTDPVYGIDGGRGGDARDFRKGAYVASFEDTEEYVRSVCVPVVKAALARTTRGVVTPGVRCLHLYPRPADIGCFWTPAAATHGPWGFTCFQPILYYGRDFRAGRGAWPSGRLVTEAAPKVGHPCPKPEIAWRWLVAKVSDTDDTILDPFLGSGTTLAAAMSLNRRAIGIEIEERYCEIAARRLEDPPLLAAVKAEQADLFSEVPA
jgi:DNA modification methylase